MGREEEVRRLTSLVLATQADISSLRKKGQQCEEQLTQLQDSKKTAVAGEDSGGGGGAFCFLALLITGGVL